MRLLYLVAYDIADKRRLRRVYKTMRGFGDHLQLSVFRCELNDQERVEMIAALTREIHHRDDHVLIAPLGPPDGQHATGILQLGRSIPQPERHAVVI